MRKGLAVAAKAFAMASRGMVAGPDVAARRAGRQGGSENVGEGMV